MYALETVGDSSVSLRPEQKACRECGFDGKDAFVWLLTRSGKFICLPSRTRLWSLPSFLSNMNGIHV